MSRAHTLRALAALLSYPDEALQAALPELGVLLSAQPQLTSTQASLRALMTNLAAQDLFEAQSAYINTFDRGRSACLNLFEHVHGDSRDRGQAMVDLMSLYERHGLKLLGTELPDYLPAFLEFASLFPGDEALAHIREVAPILASIRNTLTRRSSPYAAIFSALLCLIGEGASAADHSANIPEDNCAQALDEQYAEAPVTFMGNCAPQSPRAEQPIHFVGRRA
ncbi:nitrate reductase molybdenum cofactor assembly chaperone [Piscinibacterium candidicorallinum]|jgi:nitrate reductase delta subunit|uniref:Nitrate reductase molybdenum cofactor assembly chaperone n=1 Tax=Piscinibacterium candidicorallinum TaxID=1793872 RepID=A0ABV7H5J7_9BURK